MNAPLSTAMMCTSTGSRGGSARPSRRRGPGSALRKSARWSDGVRSWREHDTAVAPMKRFEIITEADARLLPVGESRDAGSGRAHHAARTRHAARTASHRGRRQRVGPGRGAARARGGNPNVDPRQRSHRRRPAAGARDVPSRSGPVGDRVSAPTGPIRWTTRTWRRPCRRPVARGEADAGIVIDGAGIGSAIAANKIRRHPGRDGDHRDDRALFARAQRRERADARRHARHPRRGAGDRHDLARHADAASRATSGAWRRSATWSSGADVTRDELQRLIDLIVQELSAVAVRAAESRCACHAVQRRLLPGPAAGRDRRGRDACRRASRRAARRPASRR